MDGRERHARASAAFVELRGLAESERELALAELARADEALASEVRSLLAHDAPDDAADGAPPPVAVEPGRRIGPYRVLAPIGRGGSGQVFLAEQSEPVRRRVALKLVPEAALEPELAARFEVERRALEATDHPGIARILDAGRTEEGVPWLAMDHIDGVAITEYCDGSELGLEPRVELLCAVADAVQHAHQRGVIHRDLKPANILVSRPDGRPRVVDFGIAKPVAGRLDALAPRTSGLPIGTPSYMAPEQTGAGEIDTRADVYALGAVLYELLAGRPPVDGSGDLLEVLARIRGRVPPPASRARAELGLAPLAGRVSARDLDLIVAKALEKEPARRYASAGALIEDLERLLRREPVVARAPTARYRLARFAQRNRVAALALGAVALTLVLGVAGLAAGLLEARRQRATALDQMDAQAEINRFLTEDLLAAASPERGGEGATVRDVLEAASASVDERFPGRPLVAAAVHHALGEAFAVLGAFERAEPHLARAVELRRAAGADSPDTVRSEIAAASLLVRRERYAEARPVLEELVPRARRVLGRDDRDLYAALNALGVVAESLGMLDPAEIALTEALEGRARLLGASDPAALETVANLAFVHEGRGDVERALALQLDTLRTAEALAEPPRMTLLGFYNNVGATYQDLGRDADAAPYLRKAEAIAAELLGAEHPATLTIRGNLAALEAELGEPARAAELYGAVAEARERSLGPNALDTLIARYGRWDAVSRCGRHAEAAEGFERLLADAQSLAAEPGGREHWLVPQAEVALARELAECGRKEEARALAEDGEARLRALLGPDHPRAKGGRAVLESLR